MSDDGNGPKFCAYKISQDIMDNPEAIHAKADEAKEMTFTA